MKTIGMIGGTSWVSTVDYYRVLNTLVHERLGGINAARCVLYSFNLGEVKKYVDTSDWPGMLALFADVSRKLIASGAECLMLCANTPHVIADDLRRAVDVPVIHIAEATADAVAARGLKTVALLGTKPTMEMPFFHTKLAARGIKAIVPGDADRQYVHDNIFGELTKNIFLPETKARYLALIDRLRSQGAEGAILACTELPLLLKQEDAPVPLFDTIDIHCRAVVDFALL